MVVVGCWEPSGYTVVDVPEIDFVVLGCSSHYPSLEARVQVHKWFPQQFGDLKPNGTKRKNKRKGHHGSMSAAAEPASSAAAKEPTN
jgi:hypothetical protein